jgi:hypothetical protein
MHIIFGKEQAVELTSKYTVLELDTFQIGKNGPEVTAYCALESIPLGEMLTLSETSLLHDQLIKEYTQRHWGKCLALLTQLQGKWNGELDSFYQNLRSRIEQNIVCDPGTDWSAIVMKD